MIRIKARVVVNGIGVIGKRVAHAVRLQDDMELVGISDIVATSTLRTVLEPAGPLFETDLFSSLPDKVQEMRDSGMHVEGSLEELLASGNVDVVVDCTPKGIEEKNKPMYDKHKVKQVYQGGAKAEVAPLSFSAVANYDKALKTNAARVVSCNTTSLCRTLYAVNNALGIEEVFGALVRRATDPWDEKTGPINATIPETHVPSHQGPDLQTIMPELNIVTMAVKVPTTLAHVHLLQGKLKKESTTEKLKDVLENAERVILLKEKHGYKATSQIIERFRDLCRPRYDMYEVAIWDESIKVDGNRFYWIHAVHSESIVIPENIDCIRAMMGLESDKKASIQKTNKSLGIK